MELEHISFYTSAFTIYEERSFGKYVINHVCTESPTHHGVWSTYPSRDLISPLIFGGSFLLNHWFCNWHIVDCRFLSFLSWRCHILVEIFPLCLPFTANFGLQNRFSIKWYWMSSFYEGHNCIFIIVILLLSLLLTLNSIVFNIVLICVGVCFNDI